MSVGESYVHIIHFSTQIEFVFQHCKFKSGTEVIGTFIFAFYIHRSGYSEHDFIFMQTVRISLSGGHHAFGHISKSPGIEQGRDVPIITQRLCSRIDRSACAVEQTDFIAKLVGNQTVNLYSQIEAGTDIGRHRIQ